MSITTSFRTSIDKAFTNATRESSKCKDGHLHLKDAKSILTALTSLSNTSTRCSLPGAERLEGKEIKMIASKLSKMLDGVNTRKSDAQGNKREILERAIKFLPKITQENQVVKSFDDSGRISEAANKASDKANIAITKSLDNVKLPEVQSRWEY
ncbi:hypothetical protein HB976_02295 [Yersinia mollaretii]|uniref:hypothetical protein n=1 Tax=Yersinia mollaretii TaxID=33060 RepID=UPI001427D403|nr:hypothetical protein [Yersinia mollaretii]MDA5533862.1 hypothetical protein [Yersinia mollaretii]NIL01792.1 hypothetical protein [Yersinia mollaretii]